MGRGIGITQSLDRVSNLAKGGDSQGSGVNSSLLTYVFGANHSVYGYLLLFIFSTEDRRKYDDSDFLIFFPASCVHGIGGNNRINLYEFLPIVIVEKKCITYSHDDYPSVHRVRIAGCDFLRSRVNRINIRQVRRGRNMIPSIDTLEFECAYGLLSRLRVYDLTVPYMFTEHFPEAMLKSSLLGSNGSLEMRSGYINVFDHILGSVGYLAKAHIPSRGLREVSAAFPGVVPASGSDDATQREKPGVFYQRSFAIKICIQFSPKLLDYIGEKITKGEWEWKGKTVPYPLLSALKLLYSPLFPGCCIRNFHTLRHWLKPYTPRMFMVIFGDRPSNIHIYENERRVWIPTTTHILLSQFLKLWEEIGEREVNTLNDFIEVIENMPPLRGREINSDVAKKMLAYTFLESGLHSFLHLAIRSLDMLLGLGKSFGEIIFSKFPLSILEDCFDDPNDRQVRHCLERIESIRMIQDGLFYRTFTCKESSANLEGVVYIRDRFSYDIVKEAIRRLSKSFSEDSLENSFRSLLKYLVEDIGRVLFHDYTEERVAEDKCYLNWEHHKRKKAQLFIEFYKGEDPRTGKMISVLHNAVCQMFENAKLFPPRFALRVLFYNRIVRDICANYSDNARRRDCRECAKRFAEYIYDACVPHCFDGCYTCVLDRRCNVRLPMVREFTVSRLGAEFIYMLLRSSLSEDFSNE